MGQQTWQTTAKGTIALILLDAVSIAGILGKAAWGQQNPLAAWDVRTGLEQSAAEIQQFVQQTHRGRAVIYIYAEPALFYHLRAQGIEAGPVADLGFADRPNPVPVYVAVGPHAERSTGFAEDFEKHAQQLELVEAFDFIPSRLVLLNYYAPERLNHPNFDPEQTMKLYRLKSP